MDFNVATKKAATKRIKQAVADPIMARLNSFRPDPTRSPRTVMEQRRMSQTGTRGESVQSTRKLGVNGSEESPERAQRAKEDVFHEVAGRAQTHCTRSWRSTRLFTTINSNEMKPINLQEEARGARECGQRRLSHGGRGELGHHVQR